MSTINDKLAAVGICVSVMEKAKEAIEKANEPHPQFDQVASELRDAIGNIDAVLLKIIQCNAGAVWEPMDEDQRAVINKALS